MDQGDQGAVEFGRFRLEPERRLLTKGGSPVPLGARAFEILCVLVAHAPNVVGNRTLLEQAWAGVHVHKDNLRVQVAALRKALGDGEGGNRYISTVTGMGYCFVAPLSRVMPGLAAEPPSRQAPPETNLPLRQTEIIGRDRELAELQDWLTRSRLVTLVGPGGIGKTRLAMELGWRALEDFPAGVWLIDLAPLTGGDAVASATATALGVAVAPAEATVEAIIGALGKLPRLLIFDNCEHLIDAAAALIRTLLERARGLRVLATSQQDLHLAAEQVYGLDPLEVPPAGAVEIRGFAAADLFAARARAADRLFELHDGNSAGVGEICRHLDGLPLALEMAAARLRMLGVEGLRRGLDDRLRMLKGAPERGPRHASLREVVEWSHGLLAPVDQQVFRRLAAFPSSFSLEAAIAVAGGEGDESWDVVDALGRLIERSLVTLERHEPPRYRLLETLRLYATETLQASGEAAAIAERHARHFMAVFDEAVLNWDETPDPDWIARYQPELENLRTALDWALAEPERRQVAIALVGSGGLFLCDAILIGEGLKYVDRTVPLIGEDTPPAMSARLLSHAVALAQHFYDPRCPLWAERAVALYRQLDDRRGLASALTRLGFVDIMRKRYAEAETVLLEAQQFLAGTKSIKRRFGVMNLLGTVSYYTKTIEEARRYFAQAFELARTVKSMREWLACLNLGAVEYMSGNIDRAIELTREALGQARLRSAHDWLGLVLCSLGAYLIAKGNPAEARPVLEEALVLLVETRNYGTRVWLQPWAMLAAVEGRLAEAAQLIGFVDALRRRNGQMLPPAELSLRDRLMAILQAGLPPAELETLQEEGARWSEAEAIAFAADRLLPRPAGSDP